VRSNDDANRIEELRVERRSTGFTLGPKYIGPWVKAVEAEASRRIGHGAPGIKRSFAEAAHVRTQYSLAVLPADDAVDARRPEGKVLPETHGWCREPQEGAKD
jgi:hypothetical protein